MLLRIGIIGVLILLAVIFLNILLKVVISIMMYGIGIFVLVALGVIIFSPTKKLDDYRKYFQMKMEEFKLKLRVKSME